VVLPILEVAEYPKFGTARFSQLEPGASTSPVPLLTVRVELGTSSCDIPSSPWCKAADGRLTSPRFASVTVPKPAGSREAPVEPGLSSGGGGAGGATAISRVERTAASSTYFARGNVGSLTQYRP